MIEVKNKDGEVVAIMCLPHNHGLSQEQAQDLASSLAAECRELMTQLQNILEFPEAPSNTPEQKPPTKS